MKHRSSSDDHRTLGNIPQFPYVARPGIACRASTPFCGIDFDPLAHPLAELLHKRPYDRQYVLPALTKRWHGNLKNVQAVVKVFPGPALADQPGKRKSYDQRTKRAPENHVALFIYLFALCSGQSSCNLLGLGHLQLEILSDLRAIAYPFLSVFVTLTGFLLEAGPFCVKDFIADVLD